MHHQDKLLEQAKKYCDYTERCIQDVRSKLKQWQASDDDIETIIHQLIELNYLNERRYANAFVKGKLIYNKWGKKKISFALQQKNISKETIQLALHEIDDTDYLEVLRSVLSSKNIREKDPYKLKGKLAQFAIQKGFEPPLVWEILNE